MPQLPPQIDLCLIDGGHDLASISHDWEQLRQRCRITLFHDVANHFCPDAVAFWQRLKKDYRGTRCIYECTAQPNGTQGGMMGFGLLLPLRGGVGTR